MFSRSLLIESPVIFGYEASQSPQWFVGDGLIIEGRKSSYKVDRKERENYGQVLSLTGCFTIHTVFYLGIKDVTVHS